MQEIYVVNGFTKPLLRKPAITALNLVAFAGSIQLQEIMEMFPSLFTGLGRPKDSYCIKFKQGQSQTFQQIRCQFRFLANRDGSQII